MHVPQFTVSATDKHFQAISDIVTNLVLYSDAAHKTRSDKLDTLLFSYDFTDLASAAHVVSDLQARLRQVVEAERAAESRLVSLGDHGKAELLTLKAQILSLAEELTLIFDAIKLAQDKVDEHHDHKSALLLRTSSSEISWRMLDDQRDLLAKLAVRDIDYSWLSRQDSSTVNKLQAGDLQAFAGSPRAVWAEILSKHNEPSNHPLLKVSLSCGLLWLRFSSNSSKVTSYLPSGPFYPQLEAFPSTRTLSFSSILCACKWTRESGDDSWSMSGRSANDGTGMTYQNLHQLYERDESQTTLLHLDRQRLVLPWIRLDYQANLWMAKGWRPLICVE